MGIFLKAIIMQEKSPNSMYLSKNCTLHVFSNTILIQSVNGYNWKTRFAAAFYAETYDSAICSKHTAATVVLNEKVQIY